ncbi:MAG: sigma-70 family RNA polymerase sigma factor [Clostridia bacterium]|nr:sigma-70 family RNA polymerase sigma factor [Clostridia bacterium]
MDKILKKAIKGDKDAFIKVMQSMEKKIYIIAKAKLSNEEDIKDVIQETIYKSYKNIKDLKDTSKFENWIISILINNCNQVYRNKKNIIHIEYNENEVDNLETNSEYIKSEENIDFFRFLELLDEIEKEIFILFYSNDYTTKQISEILNINENTIKTKLKRARQKIKEYIERWDRYGT